MHTRTRHILQTAAFLGAALSASLAGPTWAQPKGDDHAAHQAASPATASTGAADLADGEVRKIDKDTGRLTLRHGEIRHLDMPGMTMVFQVREPALLDKLKVGDKVRFRAEKAGSGYAVTAIETAR
jgi:Cu(I)/Ag(I) efflux system periplasmic protein CusF